MNLNDYVLNFARKYFGEIAVVDAVFLGLSWVIYHNYKGAGDKAVEVLRDKDKFSAMVSHVYLAWKDNV